MHQAVRSFLESEMEQGHIPGANILISHQGQTIMNEVLGYRIHTADEQEPMKPGTIFDVASLTKVVATLPAILKLMDAGEIRLDDSMQHFFPDLATEHNQEITLRHLITHTSGLTAFRPFYKGRLGTAEIIEQIFREKLASLPGTEVCYSDLGFILLGEIVRKVSGMTLDKFASEQIFKPLGMQETGYNPDFPRDRFAATEYDEATSEFIIGKVHDENARSMGGVSGHAGLFSTITDLSKYTQMIENDGQYDGEHVLSSAAMQLSKKNHTDFSKINRGIGWELNGIQTSCGDYFSSEAYGHTGFTGTSIWFDPRIQLHVILLTNRVHYGRHPHMIRLRPRLHNLIRSHLEV